MRAISAGSCACLLLTICVASVWAVPVPYDYSATLECLDEPLKSQYEGGIILNPELNDGLQGWSGFAGSDVQLRESDRGNKFIASVARSRPYHSPSQKLHLQKTILYSLSAWVQVSNGSEAPVTAVVKTMTGFTHAGVVHAKSGCWSMLKGGLTVNVSGPAELYFEANNTKIEIWVDNISLQPFTQEEWNSHIAQNVEQVRKKKVRIRVVDVNGSAVAGANVSLYRNAGGFPLGCAINRNILNNAKYSNWFLPRFKLTTFEDEMKWYSTESSQGKEDYSAADALMQFAKRSGISVRGHNVLWDDPRYQTGWVSSLSGDQLKSAAVRRVNSVMSRYKGQLIAWDVVNENLHFRFLEDKIGDPNASAMFYNQAYQIDPGTMLFMNDFNTMEEPGDPAVKPDKYIAKMKQIAAAVGGAKLAIGLEGHFHVPNIPYMRSALDMLASSGFPIWITELDVSSHPQQAEFLEKVLTEAHGHAGVEGIVLWGAWKPQGCYAMCLTDNNFSNLPTGDVVDRLRSSWTSAVSELSGITDSDGFFDANVFHGEYKLTVGGGAAASSVQGWKVSHEMGEDEELRTLKVVV